MEKSLPHLVTDKYLNQSDIFVAQFGFKAHVLIQAHVFIQGKDPDAGKD